MIPPKLVSVATKFGELLFPSSPMMRDHLGLSQRQRVEAMAERRQAVPWEKIMDAEIRARSGIRSDSGRVTD